ncbi:MAG: Fis family transcriptional regulator [Halieaceae bacterium]|jgi:Fis family transcriptional regulator
MSKAEAAAESAPTALFELTQPSEAATVGSLREAVDLFVRRYLDEMDGETGSDFYALMLSEVEAPMLQAVMEYTRHNQTRAAQMLGLNRGTLRKKLKQCQIAGRE